MQDEIVLSMINSSILGNSVLTFPKQYWEMAIKNVIIDKNLPSLKLKQDGWKWMSQLNYADPEDSNGIRMNILMKTILGVEDAMMYLFLQKGPCVGYTYQILTKDQQKICFESPKSFKTLDEAIQDIKTGSSCTFTFYNVVIKITRHTVLDLYEEQMNHDLGVRELSIIYEDGMFKYFTWCTKFGRAEGPKYIQDLYEVGDFELSPMFMDVGYDRIMRMIQSESSQSL